jgi:hypothetical protein
MLAAGVEVPSAPRGERAVSFALSQIDIANANRYLLRGRPRLVIAGSMLIIIVASYLTSDAMNHRSAQTHHATSPLLSLFFALGLPLIIFVAFVFVFYVMMSRRKPKDDDIALGPRTISISPKGLYAHDRRGEVRLKWNTIHTIANDRNQIFFLVVQGTGGYAIPKWAFADANEADAFYNEAVKFQEAAKRP